MTFILLTGSIMAISIFLIYRLCRLAGIEMKWISLVLCAVLAFIVNALAISMSAFWTARITSASASSSFWPPLW